MLLRYKINYELTFWFDLLVCARRGSELFITQSNSVHYDFWLSRFLLNLCRFLHSLCIERFITVLYSTLNSGNKESYQEMYLYDSKEEKKALPLIGRSADCTFGWNNFWRSNLLLKQERFKKIAWIWPYHLHLQCKLNLLVGKFTWGNWVMSTNFLVSKVCWQRPAMFCFYTSSKHSHP